MSDMSDIYYGRVSSPWCIDIERWDLDRDEEVKDFAQA